MYPPLWTSHLVAMHDDIGNRFIVWSRILWCLVVSPKGCASQLSLYKLSVIMKTAIITLHNVCAVHQGGALHWGISWVHWGVFSTSGGSYSKCGGRLLGKQLNLYGNPSVLNILFCSHDIPHPHHGIPPVYSWYQYTGGISWAHRKDIMINLGRSFGKQLNLYGSPSVLNTLRCTQWYPQCTEHLWCAAPPPPPPEVYCTDQDVMQGNNPTVKATYTNKSLQNCQTINLDSGVPTKLHMQWRWFEIEFLKNRIQKINLFPGNFDLSFKRNLRS